MSICYLTFWSPRPQKTFEYFIPGIDCHSGFGSSGNSGQLTGGTAVVATLTTAPFEDGSPQLGSIRAFWEDRGV